MAALAGVAASLNNLPRNGWNSHSSYDYITIEDIYDGLRKKLGEANIDFQPSILDISINSSEKGGKVRTAALLTLGFKFIHGEDGSVVEAKWFGESTDTSDKAVSKAISMAVKSYLKAKFLISSGDDDDPDSETPEGAPHSKPHDPKREEPRDRGGNEGDGDGDGWTTKMESAVRRQDGYAEFREICEERGYDPVDVARQAYQEGVTVKSDLITYVSGMPKVGPIEVATMDAISDLFKALEYGTVSKPNTNGSTAIRQILQVPAGDNVPAIKRLNESEGQLIVKNLKAEADKQKS